MSNFAVFKIAIGEQFARMQKHPLFRVAADKDEIWEKYLASFPAGTNPIYRKRSEYDCSCCKGFVRAIGDVVAIIDGKLVTLWDVTMPGQTAYQQVSDKMAEFVQSLPVQDKFLHFQKRVGSEKTFEQITGSVQTWNHFFVNVDSKFVKKNIDIPSALAVPRESKNVLLRSLKEIDKESVTTVLDLITQGSLYRGEENKFAVNLFLNLKIDFDKIKTDRDQEIFSWINSETAGYVAKIRNTSIGTLLVDLAEGMDLERAVKSFEAKVAPTNYKRPTALVTKAMIENAKKAVEDLGLTSALKRRNATVHDITVNNIVFANRDSRRTVKAKDDDVFSTLATKAENNSKKFDKIEEIGIEKFLSDVLPRAESIEVLFENRHVPNLVSLIAAEDPTAGKMFKWDNEFSWSYNGEMADSIKERVKNAGGNIVGDLCCRLSWDYIDDLDFHMKEPDKYEIHFGNLRTFSNCYGTLDLDANGRDGARPNPAENIYYPDKSKMKEGVYELSVHNYSRRSTGCGFVVEIEFDGQIHRIEYNAVIGNDVHIAVAKIRYSKSSGFEIIESLVSSQISRDVWGLKTQTYYPVNLLMLSPNYWNEKAVGNKHYFFMVDGAKNDGSARGFFNEFLNADLDKHRKVLEMVGGKLKVEASDEQLSGLGFSSTVRNSVVCRVKGSFTRVLKVTF